MESVKITEVIRVASNVSMLLPLALYFSRIRHASREIHIIGTLLIVSGVCDMIGFILFGRQQSTVLLINTYYIILFFLLTRFYYEALFANNHRILIWTAVAVYVVAYVLVALFVQSFFEYQTVMWLITAIIMLVYSIAYFFHSLSIITAAGAFGSSLIWINIGVMLYFCLNLFLFVMGNHLLNRLDPETGALIWSTHNINNIIKNVLFAVGIYCCQRNVLTMRKG